MKIMHFMVEDMNYDKALIDKLTNIKKKYSRSNWNELYIVSILHNIIIYLPHVPSLRSSYPSTAIYSLTPLTCLLISTSADLPPATETN